MSKLFIFTDIDHAALESARARLYCSSETFIPITNYERIACVAAAAEKTACEYYVDAEDMADAVENDCESAPPWRCAAIPRAIQVSLSPKPGDFIRIISDCYKIIAAEPPAANDVDRRFASLVVVRGGDEVGEVGITHLPLGAEVSEELPLPELPLHRDPTKFVETVHPVGLSLAEEADAKDERVSDVASQVEEIAKSEKSALWFELRPFLPCESSFVSEVFSVNNRSGLVAAAERLGVACGAVAAFSRFAR